MRKRNLSIFLALAVLVMTLAAPVCADEPTSGLVGWWRAEGNANDSAGSNNGTLNGGATFATGKVGQAFSLDGSDDSVDVGTWFNLQSFTISLWVNPAASQQTYADIIDNNHWTGRSWAIQQNGDNLNQYSFGAAGASGAAFPAVYFTLPANQWTHVVITRGASTRIGTVYLNGVTFTSVTGVDDINYGGVQNLHFGRHDSLGRYWAGKLDEIKVYNRELNANEVANLSGFNFISQTGMPLNTTIVSNPVALSFISAESTISISGGAYSVSTDGGANWSAFSSTTPATVSLNNQVKVRQTSSASNSTMTTATLTIGGVTGAFNVTTAASSDPNATGLVAWWKAENNAYDSVGGNHGTAMNGATYGTGRVGQAFSLDGVNDYVDAGTNDAFNFNGGAGDFTIQAWIKKNANVGTGIIGKATHGPGGPYSGPYSGWDLGTLDDGSLFLSGVGVWDFRSSPNTIIAGNWYHVAVTKNGSSYKLYSNGQEVASASHGNLETSSSPLLIGSVYSDSYFFNGLIDEVKIFNRALSVSEIAKLAGKVPDAFSFTAQTGMPVSTSIVSNPITVTGIITTAISITGGEYQINSGTWTASGGMVSNGDIVMVRQTSSASPSTMTTATLTIGGVTGAFNVTTAASGDPNASGLVAWWKAENNGYDSVGGNHGTPMNGATYGTGRVGQAFSLDGVDDYILVGDPVPASLQIQNEITLSAWIYVTQYPSGDGITGLGLIAGSQKDGSGSGATIFLDGRTNPDSQTAPPGHIHFQIGDGALWHTTNVNAQVPLNQWVHIVATRKANEDAKVYYNGVLKPLTSVPWSGAISYSNAWFAIGQQKDVSRPFKGLIDEVKIFNKALSALEVSTLAGTKPDAFTFMPQTGVPVSATIVSDPITVTGISSLAAISISGAASGAYQINGGSWAASSGLVSNGDVILVRQTSSASNSTMTTATLTIGGVEGAFNVTTAASGDPNASGLVSWWRAENNAYDSVGGNHGTAMNGATYATGKVGQAFSFDGGDDYVQTNYNFPFTSDFTIGVWVKPERMADLEFVVGTEDGFGASCGGWSITWNVPAASGKFGFAGGCGGGENWTASNTSNSYAVDQWHYVVAMFEGAVGKIYVDGMLDVQFSRSCAIIAGTNLRMGMYPNRIARAFKGFIDEVKIFNRALSALEISTLAGTKPDAFSFTAQTGVALSTPVESNAITVTGITNPAAISITSGEYSVNGSSSWTSSSGTVSSGDTVKVRLTSSGSYSTMLTATLTIGSVSGAFNVTTMPQPYLLTVTKDGTGSGTVTVNSGSLSWSGPTGTALYAPNTSVDIGASADPGSNFKGFTVDCISNTSPCTVTMSGPKSVTATFKLKADFDATPTSGQAPMAVQFTDLSITGATSWSWTFGDGGTSTLQNPVHMYKTPAEYPARYTVSLTANGATTTKSDFIILDSVCSNPPYKIGNAAPAPYPNIQAAYDSMGNATMQLQALVFSTGLMLNKPYNITLQGGYGCDFTSNPGDTILSDKLTIKDGKVTIEKLTIK